MPETRVERGLFVLGLVAIAALGFAIAHLWHHARVAAPAPQTAAISTQAGTTAQTATESARTGVTATTRSSRTTGSTTATRSTATASPTGPVSLVLTARVETWIEVRSLSATGQVLYAGMLPAGSSKAFRSRSLWARFGSGGNLSARLDGKALHLPSGTYDATFDVHGFRQLTG
jgi:hypothetical protein